jgi:hypothetical protein
MTDYVIGIDLGTGSEYAGESIWQREGETWVMVWSRVWEVKQ